MLSHRLRAWCCPFAILAGVSSGCSTTKQSGNNPTATEQLLVSNAVDQSLNNIDFSNLAGLSVFVEEKYLDCLDKAYIIGSIRQKLLEANATIAAKVEEADAIMEIRSGGVGTDIVSSYLGIPGFTMPGMVAIPDIKIANRDSQKAVAKIGVVVYDAKAHRELGEGGVSLAKSDEDTVYFMGIGPHRSGTLTREANRLPPPRPSRYIREVSPKVAAATPSKAEPRPDKPVTQPDDGKVALMSGEAGK